MTGKTYSIIRSTRKSTPGTRTSITTTEVVLERGLSWEEADSKREKMAAADRAANPGKSCWVRDMFIVQMEK